MMTLLESHVHYLREKEDMAHIASQPSMQEQDNRKRAAERKYPPGVVEALDEEEKRKLPKPMKRKKDHPARKQEEFVDEKTTPKHYSELSITPVDVIESWDLDFFTGTALKYLARRGNKPGETEIDDLKKAVWYLQRRIRNLESSEE